jgi:hypothetical protein
MQEAVMRFKTSYKAVTIACICLGMELMLPEFVRGQEGSSPAPAASSAETSQDDFRTLAEVVRQLQAQVQSLNSQVGELRAEGQSARAESITLRKELNAAKAQLASLPGASPVQSGGGSYASAVQPEAAGTSTGSPVAGDVSQGQNGEESSSRLEEDVQLASQKINEQSQTKVESGSKYRLRLSGIVLFNLVSNRGSVDNEDFPEIATRREPLDSGVAFGGSLRQSQITLQTFGPDIAGAHTSADLSLDFAGGFPETANGSLLGNARIRTGTIRLDWAKTSIVAGQDQMFFAPLNPTSLASLAVPALSYSGNLWGWTPQVRIEHRVALSDRSSLLIQGGILQSVSGEITESEYEREPSRGEQSGQPAYAARIAWSQRLFGQKITGGVGGYYGRQSWGLGRRIDGWTGTADLLMPLGKRFEFSGEFYRGRAVGGFGGGIGQDVLWNGALDDAGTTVHGLDSMGGWAQLKFKPAPKFEVNGAFGNDSPFSSELRVFGGNPIYSGLLLSKNASYFVNFIYQPRSDVVFSTEYRYLKSFVLDSSPNVANIINFNLGYIF